MSIFPCLYDPHFSGPLVEPKRTLTDYSGNVIPVTSCLEANVTVQGKLCTTFMYIAKRGSPLIRVDVVRGTGPDLNQVLQIKVKAADPVKKVTKFMHQVKLKPDVL